jgi:hypothetical protein
MAKKMARGAKRLEVKSRIDNPAPHPLSKHEWTLILEPVCGSGTGLGRP